MNISFKIIKNTIKSTTNIKDYFCKSFYNLFKESIFWTVYIYGHSKILNKKDLNPKKEEERTLTFTRKKKTSQTKKFKKELSVFSKKVKRKRRKRRKFLSGILVDRVSYEVFMGVLWEFYEVFMRILGVLWEF